MASGDKEIPMVLRSGRELYPPQVQSRRGFEESDGSLGNSVTYSLEQGSNLVLSEGSEEKSVEQRKMDVQSESSASFSRFATLGQEMGLEGQALADFVLRAVHTEKEDVRREKEFRDARLMKEKEERRREIEFKDSRIMREKEEVRRENEEMRRENEEMRREKESREASAWKKGDLQIKREKLEKEQAWRKEEREVQNVHLDPLKDGMDVDSYISHFERVAVLCGWKKSSWPARFISLVHGKARDAVLRLAPEDLTDYEKVKAALLRHFRLDSEAYRQRFRTMHKASDETFDQLLVRMRSCFSLWCQAAGKDKEKVEDVVDMIMQEQLYSQFTPELIKEVSRTTPVTADQVASEATKVMEAKRRANETRSVGLMRSNQVDVNSDHGNQNSNIGDSNGRVGGSNRTNSNGYSSNPTTQRNNFREQIKCFNCNKLGHISRCCPDPPRTKLNRVSIVKCDKDVMNAPTSLCTECAAKPFTPRCKVTVNGIEADAVRDTGASYCVVAKHLVRPEDYTGEVVPVVLAQSRCQYSLPVAMVYLVTPFVEGRMMVLVMEEPNEEVLVGNWYQRFLGDEKQPIPVYATPVQINAVKTRAQLKREREPVTPLVKDAPFEIASREDLIKEQREDAALAAARQAAREKKVHYTHHGEVTYFYKDEVLMREFKKGGFVESQVCVPTKLRSCVLRLAHDVPMAGHLATRKTKDRIAPHFYWPGMYKDIHHYCASCTECQKTINKGKVPKVPLIRCPPSIFRFVSLAWISSDQSYLRLTLVIAMY